ncbi:MAG: Glu/Leu/Phe/Val dehydrogenase dimerization domain-containing protein [Gemmatimonadota bacterium]
MNPLRGWPGYDHYLQRPPELTLEWNDAPTGARGWLVLNSLRGGAAGGGTRMRVGVTLDEVVHLAKTMELKFAFSGPPIGGAKSGIDFDPADPRKGEVLARWFRAIRPFLSDCYGTAGDVGVDEQREVVPLCRSLGLEHPQQGIVTGYLRPGVAGLPQVHARLRDGLALPVTTPELALPGGDFRVSDLITGYGAARATVRLLKGIHGTARGARAIVEGFGNVGGSAAFYLARLGVRIVGITDAHAGLLAPEGLAAQEVEDLLRRRQGRTLPDHPRRMVGEARNEIYRTPAEVFLPAAVSGSVTLERLDDLTQAGVRAIVCGANQPFRESAPGRSDLLRAADDRFSVVMDAVASMGMARCFHHLMRDERQPQDGELFQDVAQAVEEAVDMILERARGKGDSHSPSGPTGLVAAALDEALTRLG